MPDFNLVIDEQKCIHCGELYGFASDSVSLPGVGQWTKYPYGNWTNQEIEIFVESTELFLTASTKLSNLLSYSL